MKAIKFAKKQAISFRTSSALNSWVYNDASLKQTVQTFGRFTVLRLEDGDIGTVSEPATVVSIYQPGTPYWASYKAGRLASIADLVQELYALAVAGTPHPETLELIEELKVEVDYLNDN